MAYSFAQLEGLWIQAGGSRKLAPVMAAIALAESGGNPDATGGVGEKGLWQINPHAWGSLATYDPAGNARAAVHVEKVQGLSAWSTWNSGAYKHFLGSAAPVNVGLQRGRTTPSSGSGDGTAAAAEAAQDVAQSVGKLGKGGGGLVGFFNAIKAGLAGGLQVSSSSGSTTANAIIGAQDISKASDVAQALAALTLPFTVLANAIDWFFVPSHWIRILAGIGGGVLVIGGVYELAHTGQDKPAALPAGIAMTGGGGVLLFIAFHNLDPNIRTVGELLADLQGKAQTGLSATTSPAQAVTQAGG